MEYEIDTMIETMHEAVSISLENLIFLEVENSETINTLPEIKSNDFIVSLKTLEPFNENIFFIFTEPFANEIVCEMAGVPDGNFADDIMKDALGELTNTIVGRYMAKLVAENQVFELDLPECERYGQFNESLPCNNKTKILSFEVQGFQMFALLLELQT